MWIKSGMLLRFIEMSCPLIPAVLEQDSAWRPVSLLFLYSGQKILSHVIYNLRFIIPEVPPLSPLGKQGALFSFQH